MAACTVQIAQLRCYEGERFDLAPAEQFLLALSDTPDYRLLLDGLLLRTQLAASLPRLSSLLRAMITASRDLMHHPGLRDFVKVLLDAGNFLNSVRNDSLIYLESFLTDI